VSVDTTAYVHADDGSACAEPAFCSRPHERAEQRRREHAGMPQGWRDVPMPERVADLPRTTSGIPITYTVAWTSEREVILRNDPDLERLGCARDRDHRAVGARQLDRVGGAGMTIIVRRDAADPKKWVVIEDDGNGTVTIGGPFETRAYARQVAEGAQIMADRLAAKRTGAVEAERQRIVDLIQEAAAEHPDPSRARKALLSVAIDIALSDTDGWR
jgi:hypothetical protein